MRKLLLSAAVLAVGAGLLSGCSGTPGVSSSAPSGSDASGRPGTQSSAAPAPSPSLPGTPAGKGNAELAIHVVPSVGASALDYTLACTSGTPGAASSHPHPAEACAALLANPGIVAPAAQGSAQACTQQYGGPQKATVTGTVDGVAVQASFARTNGCEISAWDAAKDVIGAAGGAS